MIIILNCIEDIYSSPDVKTGKQKLIKKNVKYQKSFETNIMSIQNFIDSKGNISKKYSIVLEGERAYKTIHKFEELKRMVSPIKVEGFKYGNTKKI